jgi:hypothetical protein
MRLNTVRRASIGYNTYKDSDFLTLTPLRDLTKIDTNHYTMSPSDLPQSGEGVMDKFRAIYDKGKNLVEKASDLYSGELGTKIKNMIPSSDANARSSFTGEKHAILELANGKNGVANYMGPGTEVLKRLKRGDPGRTFADNVAKRHDIDYALAATEGTKEAQLKAIREADNRMISTLSKNKDKDKARNIQMGLRLIQAKTAGENLGVLSRSKFAGELANLSAADKAILLSNKSALAQQGFGLTLAGGSMMPLTGGAMLPGERLKIKLMKQSMSKKKKSANTLASIAGSGKRSTSTMPTAPSESRDLGKAYDMEGGALSLPGMGKKSKMKMRGMGLETKLLEAGKKLSDAVLPSLLEKLGIKIPKSILSKIVDTTLSQPGTLKDKIRLLTSNLLPLMAVKKTVGMSGGGLKLAGQGYIMTGQGLSDILSFIPKKISEHLSTALFKFFKYAVQSGAGMKKMKGGSFWSDFAKGFKMVFKPGAKILAGIATALGQPEIGIPLGIVSEAL